MGGSGSRREERIQRAGRLSSVHREASGTGIKRRSRPKFAYLGGAPTATGGAQQRANY